MSDPRPRLAITAGDPCGVGPEVVVKALADPEVRRACRPLLVGDLRHLRRTAAACGVELELVPATGGEGDDAVPVVDLDDVDPALRPGEIAAAAGEAAWDAIETRRRALPGAAGWTAS